ncbi:MAG: CvpA family protein [Planctomycetaceae bacterium]
MASKDAQLGFLKRAADMVWYDFVILALLVYTTWSGAQRGLITQLAWIAALILCFKFADQLAPAIEPQINVEQPMRHWIAMFVLYVGFSLGSFMVARILNSWMEKAKFKDFDRHLGGILGLVKGVVIAMVITFFAVTLSESLKSTVLQSRTGHLACVILDNVEPLTPEYFHDYLVKYRKELEGIHQEHLGSPTSFKDLLGHEHATAPISTEDQGQGGGFQLPDFFNGLGGSDTGASSDPGFTETTTTPTFDQMFRKLPAQLQQSLGTELQQRWNSSTPQQKQNLINNLTQSFDSQLPNIVMDFLTDSGQPANVPGNGSPDARFQQQLDEIGRVYGDRDAIVRQAMEHLAGVPFSVQQAVVADWYADVTMQPDPDRTTNDQTRLDDRILRQLDKVGIWQQLSYDLKQRLNQSRN